MKVRGTAMLHRRVKKGPTGKDLKEAREQVLQTLGRRVFQAKGERAKVLGAVCLCV